MSINHMNNKIKKDRFLKFKQNAFTLIELIMVMTIIGAMAGVFLLNYPGTRSTTRDTQRKSDLKQYQTALEGFANANSGLYPRRTAGAGNGMSALCADLSVSPCYEDPLDMQPDCDGNTCRYYIRTNDCGSPGDICATFYVLFTALEKPQSPGNYWGICSTGETGEFSISAPSDLNGATSCPI